MHRRTPSGKQKGQGLVEYALILVLVSVAVIAVLLILGPTIGNVFTKINSSLVGQASAVPSGYILRHSAPCDRPDEILINGGCYGPG